MQTNTSVKDRTAVKLTVSTDLALEAQRLCELQGIPLNLTQAVKAILTQGIRSTQAAMDKQQA
jgi:hypothetical protein